jgi:hypothetical protein
MRIGVRVLGLRFSGIATRYVRRTSSMTTVFVVTPGVIGRPHPGVPPLGVGVDAPVGVGIAVGAGDGDAVTPADVYVIYIEYWLISTGRLGVPYDMGHFP